MSTAVDPDAPPQNLRRARDGSEGQPTPPLPGARRRPPGPSGGHVGWRRRFVHFCSVIPFCCCVMCYCHAMTELVQRLCRFPGCTRPAMPGDGTGRPPVYCDNPQHHRASAWRARHQSGDDTLTPAATAAPKDRAVDTARSRATSITAQVRDLVELLDERLVTLIAELRTLGDTGAVEAQLDSVKSQAQAETAEANARAARAEEDRLKAEDDRAEADAAAAEALQAAGKAEAAAAQAKADLEQVRAELEQRVAAMVAEQTRLAEEHALERDRLVADAAARFDAEHGLRVAAEGQAAAANQRAYTETARADRADTLIVELRGQIAQADTLAQQQAETVTDLNSQVAVLTVERDTARQAVEQERAVADRRVADLQTAHEGQLARQDTETARLRRDLAEQRSRADRAEALLDRAVPSGTAEEPPLP